MHDRPEILFPGGVSLAFTRVKGTLRVVTRRAWRVPEDDNQGSPRAVTISGGDGGGQCVVRCRGEATIQHSYSRQVA